MPVSKVRTSLESQPLRYMVGYFKINPCHFFDNNVTFTMNVNKQINLMNYTKCIFQPEFYCIKNLEVESNCKLQKTTVEKYLTETPRF